MTEKETQTIGFIEANREIDGKIAVRMTTREIDEYGEEDEYGGHRYYDVVTLTMLGRKAAIRLGWRLIREALRRPLKMVWP